tara:strand:- start:3122 stop:3586 length:465 start_codon:yes stop_codon:yes gene_type:complete
MQLQYTFNGPVDQGILQKNRGNNALLTSKMAMPQKFYPSASDSLFSNSRSTYMGNNGNTLPSNSSSHISDNRDQSGRIARLKANAIGKSSTKYGLATNAPLSFRSQDTTSRNSALQRVRGGGAVAPAKKGALENTFKSGGGSRLTGRGNRQIFV